MLKSVKQMLTASLALAIGSIILAQPGIAAMSIVGITGLVDIPTARIIPDGKAAFGIGYTHKKYSVSGPEYAQVAYYVTVGYLPFLEASLRITDFPGEMQPDDYGIGDRMASVRLRVVNEGGYLPSILLGTHDMLGVYGERPTESVYFNTAYIVMSRSIRLPLIGALDVHLGYASDLMEARRHSMVGTFGGLEKKLGKYFTVMGEYDTQKYNVGLRTTLWGDRLNIDLVALGMRYISGGMSISFGL